MGWWITLGMVGIAVGVGWFVAEVQRGLESLIASNGRANGTPLSRAEDTNE